MKNLKKNQVVSKDDTSSIEEFKKSIIKKIKDEITTLGIAEINKLETYEHCIDLINEEEIK